MDKPQKIKDRIAILRAEKEAYEEDERKTAVRQTARFALISAARVARRDELLVYAHYIADWLKRFRFDDEMSKALYLRREIIVFRAKFWQGMPLTVPDSRSWAAVKINKDGVVFYFEYYLSSYGNGAGNPIWLGVIPMGYTSEAFERELVSLRVGLFNELHPDFLAQFAEAIRSGKVWNYVEESLR